MRKILNKKNIKYDKKTSSNKELLVYNEKASLNKKLSVLKTEKIFILTIENYDCKIIKEYEIRLCIHT